MAIAEPRSTAIVTGGTTVALSSFFTVTGTANPAYLVLNALDRNEYTAGASTGTGTFNGNGAALGLSGIGDDGRGAGIVFTWQAATGQYVNATYGALSQLTYTAAASRNDVTSLSLFSTTNLGLAQAYAANAYALMQTDAGGYIGSATLVSDPLNTPPLAQLSTAAQPNATPNSIAAIAQTFVGQAWNMDGCWTLASTIAAEAGAALPVHSTQVGTPGHANGEWTVIYNGPSSASSAWQSKVSTGDIVCFVPGGGGGHITTCVSGSGSTAQLIDNITYETAQGGIANPANDGSPSDILVAGAHAASREWAGVSAQSVVIYALDTPAITAAATATLTTASLTLATLARATDPANHAITQVQAYDSLAGATIGGHSAQSAATDVTAASLSALSVAYTTAGTDTLDVRAFNGTYWGDWQALTVTVTAPQPLPPRLAAQTANQTWAQGRAVTLALPASAFTDPQHQTLTYSASGLKGAALPSWLTFNPTTRAFSGTVPPGTTGTLGIVVTATDQAGLSASETFTATIPAVAPVLATPTSAQIWATGAQISDALPAGTFTDPQGQALTLRASLASGAALPSWLAFTNGVFIGTAPTTPQTLSLKVIATDASHLTAYETFTATIAAATHGLHVEPTWSRFFEPDHWAVLPSLHHT